MPDRTARLCVESALRVHARPSRIWCYSPPMAHLTVSNFDASERAAAVTSRALIRDVAPCEFRHNIRWLRSGAVYALAFLWALPSAAQNYPTKPVRVIVPFAPGGGSDLTARPVAQKLSEALGQQFVVDNRGGAAGIIGMELTAKANPDGYTLMVMSGSFAATPATQKLPFDPLKEIVPIVELGYSPHVLVVHPSIPAKTTTELIELVRAKPGTVPYASTGLGGFTHLGTEWFASLAKLKMIHVPYKSTGAAMVDVLSGQ